MENHFATIWESIADALPDRAAVVQGERRVTWGDYEDRASRLAQGLLDAGLGPDSKVGLLLYNCIEYPEAQFATMKIRGGPVNVNYRYLDDELRYLLENSDAEALVYHTSLGDRVDRIRDRLPLLELLIEVDDGGEHRVDGAVAYEELIAGTDPAPRIERSGDDIYMLYTGGTTGMPKGVMYRHEDLAGGWLLTAPVSFGLEPFQSAGEVGPAVARLEEEGRLQTVMPCCPLMHGTGMWIGLMVPHVMAGTTVLLEGRSLDPEEVLEVSERQGVNALVIVGDAMARPILQALESGRSYDLGRTAMIVSSGAMFSTEVKEGLLEYMPGAVMLDILGSTEGSMGQTMSTAAGSGPTAKFALQPGAKVFDENDNEVEPGSAVIGRVGATGHQVPVGYYKDPVKSAATFREIDGVRYSFPGDMAMVEEDGTITLLGRGSNCINTGGEKVFPEEVEEAIKTHAAVADCLVFGVEDERFGQRVSAVASLDRPGSASAEEILADARTKLASYKLPKSLVLVDRVPRAPNGKADYKAARDLSDA